MEEVWKDIVGLEGRYQVSDQSRVRNTKTGRILKTGVFEEGYEQVRFFVDGDKPTKKVHRLVAEAFIPNPLNLPFVNHINSIRHDNRIENLEWCTAQHNVQHSYDSGSNSNAGENHPKAILNWEIVYEMRKLHSEGETYSSISEKFGVKYDTAWKAIKGKNWKEEVSNA